MIPTPTTIPWRVIGAGALAAALFAAGWVTNGWRLGGQLEQMKTERERVAKSAAFDQVKAVDHARLEYQGKVERQTEIANAATKDAEQARADARTADAASDRLRQRIADLVASARASYPPAPAGSAPAGDPLGVLADVLSRADQRAGILAESARIAGQACEQSYDALRRGGLIASELH